MFTSSSRDRARLGAGDATSSNPETTIHRRMQRRDLWRRLGLRESMTREESIATCERIFAKYLGGHALMSNATICAGRGLDQLPARAVRALVAQANLALMGDAAASAHFSIGSGHPSWRWRARSVGRLRALSRPWSPAAFAKYEDPRRVEVLRLQSAARNSLRAGSRRSSAIPGISTRCSSSTRC